MRSQSRAHGKRSIVLRIVLQDRIDGLPPFALPAGGDLDQRDLHSIIVGPVATLFRAIAEDCERPVVIPRANVEVAHFHARFRQFLLARQQRLENRFGLLLALQCQVKSGLLNNYVRILRVVLHLQRHDLFGFLRPFVVPVLQDQIVVRQPILRTLLQNAPENRLGLIPLVVAVQRLGQIKQHIGLARPRLVRLAKGRDGQIGVSLCVFGVCPRSGNLQVAGETLAVVRIRIPLQQHLGEAVHLLQSRLVMAPRRSVVGQPDIRQTAGGIFIVRQQFHRASERLERRLHSPRRNSDSPSLA